MLQSPYPRSFKHSGKLGDVIYALPGLRALGGCRLYLNPHGEEGPLDVESILPLLRTQPYLESVEIWDDQPFEMDLDSFRDGSLYWTNLADAHLRLLGLPAELRDVPWLEIDDPKPLGERSVVLARSPRNHGPDGFWPRCLERFGRSAVFVGTEEEHRAFTSEFGEVPYLETSDLLDLARVIAGCELFIGNQSCPFAIAEGLKKPVIQETHPVTPNCLFLREDALSVHLPSELDRIRTWSPGSNAPSPVPIHIPLSVGNLPVCIVVHDDWWFLRQSIRSFLSGGPVTVFVSVRSWNGSDGRWDLCASEAAAAGAEVVVGDWPDEALHRRTALEEMRCRGHRHVLLPDGDEIISPGLLRSLVGLASVDAADVVRVSMATYWKSPRYLIQPPERIRPVMMVNAQTARHDYVREYSGDRLIVLDPEHGVFHHLSYAGPDERIRRKIATWSHRSEIAPDWYSRLWQGWDQDRTLTDLHPTHPTFYSWTERIETPDILRGCRDDAPVLGDPDPPRGWPSVSVVVPLYGGEDDIRSCLASLGGCADLLHETVVVDDVSPDDAAGVAQSFPFVSLLRNERNLGFAGACNRGYEATTGDVVVFLNSDTVVPRAGLIRLVESLMVSGTVGAVGPRTNHCAGPQMLEPTYTEIQNLPGFARDFAHRKVNDSEVPMLIGFCLAARRSAIEEVGGPFDERFGRGMFEDNDLSYRLARAGYRLKISQRAYVHHGGSHSLKRSGDSLASLFERNRRVFEEKWRADLESGFASHLPGQRLEPIVFRPERAPERLKEELDALRAVADVSLCMIVRDEERVLGECLRSAAGVFSQIVVVDTGSTDRTREIAIEHGAELHDFPWTDSFSDARNESLKHAKGRWVFWMDADDTLPRSSAEAILRAAANAPDDIVGFVIPVRFNDGGAAGGTQVDHVKLFRNVPGLRFEGRIHEQILGSLRKIGGQVARLDAVVMHSGYDTSPQGQERKRARDERLLKLDLEERPDHPFVLFNFGMTAHYLHDHSGAVTWLRRSIEAAEPGESHVRKAYALMGVSMRELGDLPGALAAFAEGLAKVGEDPELRFQRARVLTDLGRFEEARAEYLAMPTDVSRFFSSVDIGILGPKRAHNLGAVCLTLDRYAEAREHFREAISMGFAPSAYALLEASLEREDLRTARSALEDVLKLDGPTEQWAQGLVRLTEFRGDDPDEALWQASSRLTDGSGVKMLLARRLLERGEEDAARPLLEQLSAAGVPEAAFFLGVAATRRGRYEDALAHMRRALSLNPGHEATARQVDALESALRSLAQKPSAISEAMLPKIVGSHVGCLGPATLPVSVVIVTYNSASTIRECLESVLATIGPDDEVIIVDNNSKDDSATIAEGFARSEPRLRVTRNDRNLGYARAMNQGLLASHGEVLVMLNPDTRVFSGWVEGLSRRLTGRTTLVGPVSNVVSGDQYVERFLAKGHRPSIEELPAVLWDTQRGRTRVTKFLAGFCLMARRNELAQYGLLDEAMELGADDLELSWRLQTLGYDLAIASDVFVSHVGSVSFSSLHQSESNGRVHCSDRALIQKLCNYYERGSVPGSEDLWGHNMLKIRDTDEKSS